MWRGAAFSGLHAGSVWALLLLPSSASAEHATAASAAWQDALALRFAVHRVEVGRLDLEVVASQAARRSTVRASTFVVPLARLVDAELTPEITLAEVAIRRTGDPDGWDGEAALHDVRITDGPEDGARSIVMEGALNAAPVSVAARFAAAERAADGRLHRRFSIDATLPGIEQKLEGVLDADGRAIEAQLRLDVSAIGDLLETLGLRRQLEGQGQLHFALAGPVDDLRAEDIGLVVELESGEQLRADGRIARLSQLAGIELGFTANLTDAAGAAPRASPALKLDLLAMRGRVTGSAEALTLSGVVFSTNLTAAGVQEIGPVSVDRLIRDAQGRLALSGVRILAGDPRSPSLDLRGRIDDLLGRSGMTFAGRFDLDLIGLATGRPGPPELGRLVGELALSDASGRFQLERLSGRQDGGPLALRVEKATAQPGEPASPIAVDLQIPDLDALAAALDEAPIGGGSAAFSGTVDLGADFRISGLGEVGSSPVALDLSEDVIDGRLILRGGVESSRLLLADLPRMLGIVRLWPGRETDEAGGTAEQLRARLDAELDTKATVVDVDGSERGAFAGRLTVRDGVAVLRPLQLDYLGGRATAELSFGIGREAAPVRLEAHVRALNTGALLTEIGTRPLLEGELDAAIDLRAVGSNRAELLASLDGEIELLMGEGRVGSRLLDLAAQDIVGWLFSAGSGTRLVCAAARLRFAAGSGTVEGLILETENIQLLGAGTIDLGRETVDLGFSPRPMRGRLLPAVTSFRVHGPLADPAFSVGSAGGVAGRAVVETLTLPFNVLGALLGSLGRGSRPECTLEP